MLIQHLVRLSLVTCLAAPGGLSLLDVPATATAAGFAGRTVWPAIAGTTALRNRHLPARPLHPREREALRPVFGELVDSVTLTWNVRLMGEWTVLGHTFCFGIDAIDMCFGDCVYLSDPDPAAHTRESPALLIHELTHSVQAREAGGLAGFGQRYLQGWWVAGRDYGNTTDRSFGVKSLTGHDSRPRGQTKTSRARLAKGAGADRVDQDRLHPMRMLIAEDNQVNQRVAVAMLERMGCHADVAADGQEAVDATARVPYDLVFMDCQMPRLDDLGGIRYLRVQHSAYTPNGSETGTRATAADIIRTGSPLTCPHPTYKLPSWGFARPGRDSWPDPPGTGPTSPVRCSPWRWPTTRRGVPRTRCAPCGNPLRSSGG